MKKITITILLIIALVFANGCYFVFYGQHKAVQKLKDNQSLNLYEISSIYSMHVAICTFGWFFSPEATVQQVLMTIPHKDTVIFKNKKVSSEFREHPVGIIYYPNYNLNNLRFSVAFNGAYKNNSFVYGKMEYPYLLTPTYILNIPIYEGLIRHLQDLKILHSYHFKYVIDWFEFL